MGASNSSTVSGNLISGNGGNGVVIAISSTGNVVQGNLIGTDVTGSVDLGNATGGVQVGLPPPMDVLASDNVIGGLTDTARNVISGNDGGGVVISGSGATGNAVQGNLIGTDITGTATLGNSGYAGVLIDDAPSNVIGGTLPGAGNVISGNGGWGVVIQNPGATANQIEGNLIGTDVTGTADLGNAMNGVSIVGAPNNTVGGTTLAARNVISGNDANGVSIELGATANVVVGNLIGTDLTGTVDVGNAFDGVVVVNASGNIIGGTDAGARNVISANDRHGVEILGACLFNLRLVLVIL